MVRTAHLERALELEPAVILCRGMRYDFDESLAREVTIVPTSPLRAAWMLARSGVEILEINEPHLVSSLFMSWSAVTALRVRRLVTRHRVRVVTYAIGNSDPMAIAGGPGWKRRLRRAAYQTMARDVWRGVDRVAYGTDAARDTYAGWLGSSTRRQEKVVPALPSPRPLDQLAKDPATVLFLGRLDGRKGFPLVIRSWPLVRRQCPDATLVIVGSGPMLDDARTVADWDPSVRLVVDPPRAEIFDELGRAQVLVLPSQPSPTWREQVGLPIVEALASGCSVVTTTETGLASWLAAHGHSVLPTPVTDQDLADAVAAQIAARRPPAEVLSSLPDEDGRLAADHWMFGVDR